MMKNDELLKDTPETGEEGYTENVETPVHVCGCAVKGIRILKKEDRKQESRDQK